MIYRASECQSRAGDASRASIPLARSSRTCSICVARSFQRIWWLQEPRITCILLPTTLHARLRMGQNHTTSETTIAGTTTLEDDASSHQYPPLQRIRHPSPCRSRQPPPHRYRGQSPPHTNSVHHNSAQYVRRFDIGPHLGAGGSMKRTTDDGDGTIEHDDDDDDYRGGVALALLWGGLTWKEKRNGRYRGAGDVERDGGEKITTPTPNNSNDEHALLGIEGGSEVATNAPGITDVRHFACPPLPAPPNTNIGLPRSSQSLHSSRSRASPIIWVGEHDPAARQSPRCPRRWVSLPHPNPRSFHPITSPAA
ncbi:hypothetical protein ARMSODRAFT_968719 [Armillaria solidipes]|uniref:Uncharacterized protein n=1 Tax=Armillaria solidipes TaxID=1076256 RepID=A0A2H3C6D6_9AGAR|nr:hypothetical protein ARMSODRAFT_968719 [Armillaria solidipes]